LHNLSPALQEFLFAKGEAGHEEKAVYFYAPPLDAAAHLNLKRCLGACMAELNSSSAKAAIRQLNMSGVMKLLPEASAKKGSSCTADENWRLVNTASGQIWNSECITKSKPGACSVYGI
jgi:hypothetical protein